MEKQGRVEIVNRLMAFMSERGRRFFFDRSSGRVAVMKIERNRVYFVDERTGQAVYAYSYYRERKGFSHGGTIWALVCEFSEFIRTGAYTNGKHGYGGLYGKGWGHDDATQDDIVAFAKEIGYLPPDENPVAVS